MISLGKGQCLSEAEEEPRVEPEALPRCNESTDFPRGIMGLISHWEGIQPTYTMPRLLVRCVDIDTMAKLSLFHKMPPTQEFHGCCIVSNAIRYA